MRYISAGLFAVLALSSIPLLGQTTGTLTGRITAEGRPVSGAIIRVLGSSPARGAIAKADGSYLIAGLRAGAYDITVEALSWRKERRAGVRINIDSTTRLDVVLVSDTAVYDRGARAITRTTKRSGSQPNGTLWGKIADGDGHPLAGATIVVLGTEGKDHTRRDGSYLIMGLRTGRFNVQIDAPGFLRLTRRGVRIAADSAATLNAKLAVDTAWQDLQKSARGIPPPRTSYIEREVTAHQGLVIRGRGSSEETAARHTLPPIRGFPYFNPAAYIIRSGRNQPSGGLDRLDRDYAAETRSFLPWRPERAVIRVPARVRAASAGAIAESPMMLYRPMLSWPRDIVRMNESSRISVDDPFTGGFRLYVYPCATLCEEIVVPDWFYDPAKRDVVEPSLKDRAEWIRRYEERRDMLSPAERQLASWTRRR